MIVFQDRYAKPSTVSTLVKHIEINSVDSKGKTLLHKVIKGWNIFENMSDIYRTLLRCGADFNILDKKGKNIAYLAKKYEKTHLINLLQEKGHIPSIPYPKATTQLHISAMTGNLETVDQLHQFSGEELNAVNDAEETPLNLAVQNNHTAFVQFLIKANADLEIPKKSVTPLQEACQRGLEEIVQHLLVAKAQVQKSPSHGFSALNFAHWTGHTNIVKLLLEHNANEKDLEAKLPFQAEIDANICTASSKEPTLQQWMQCDTCNVVTCISCYKKCHWEHKLCPMRFGFVMCGCTCLSNEIRQ